MRIACVLAAVLVLSLSVARAEKPSYTFSTSVLSQYMLGKGFVTYDRPLIYDDLRITWKSGLYLELEILKNLQGASIDTNGDELDYTVGYRRKVGKYVLDGGVSVFNLSPVFSLRKGDVVHPYLGLYRPTKKGRHTTTPFVRLEYPVKLHMPEITGLFVRFGVSDDWRVSDKLVIGQFAHLLWNEDNALKLQQGITGLYGLDLRWKMNRSGTQWLTLPTFRFATPLTDVHDCRQTETVLGVGYTWKY